MARKAQTNQALPALPASASDFAEGGKLDLELAGWLTAMSQRAGDGDEAASNALIDACRTVPKLWEIMSILSSMATRAWVDLIASDRPGAEVSRRTIEKEIERKRKDVAGEDPSPLERLLAERVALCWVAATQADAQYARKLREGMSFREGEYYGKRCEQAHSMSISRITCLVRQTRVPQSWRKTTACIGGSRSSCQ